MDTNIYKPCLYIESTGTQYIDTGFKPNNNTRVVLDAQMLSSSTAQYSYGTRTSAYKVNFGVLITGGAYRSDYGESKVKLSTLTNLYQRYTFDHNKNVCTIGTVSVTNTASTFQTSLNLYLCAVNEGGVASYFGKMKIYSCQIYDNDVLIRDFHPVKNKQGVFGLYDKVNDVFYQSEGTDSFLGESNPSYTPLEYIESTGTQYIDTGFKPNNNTRVITEVYAPISGSNWFVFGARTAQQSLTYGFNVYQTKYRTHYYNGWTDYDTSISYTGRFVIDKNKNVTTIGGSNVLTATEQAYQTAYNLYLFAVNTKGTAGTFASIKMYSCQIYDNDTLIRDFKPVMRNDGVCGMLDKVNNVFYPSKGTGQFIGKTFTPLHYIESTGTQYIDTGYTPNQDTKFILDYALTTGNSGNVHMATATTGGSTPIYAFMSDSNAMTYHARYGTGGMLAFDVSGTGRFNLVRDKETSSLNGSKIIAEYETFTTGTTITLCGKNNGTSVSNLSRMRIYSCQIYDNDILVRDYKPVMRNDGVCGLYDSVTNTFYTSATDNFKAGLRSNYKQSFRRNLISQVKQGSFDSTNYMTMEALEDGFQASFSQEGLSYTLDGSTWVPLAASTNTPAINAGQKIAFKGSKIANNLGMGRFTTSHKCNLSGNCMSLTHEDSAADAYTCHAYQFKELFWGCKIVEVSVDFLPATTLADYCYDGMFYECPSLTTAPALPATILADHCYEYMFRDCPSLTTAPELPATTLADHCYEYMFCNCTSLTTAPELPATTLAQYCYSRMFSGCSSLTTAPELSATILAERCYSWMFSGTKLTTAPELPAVILADYCYEYMFFDCSHLTKMPELPATNLTPYCYYCMFQYCYNLTETTALPATTLTYYCYYRMFDSCTALVTAPVLPATTLADGCYQYMFYKCYSLTTAPELPATSLEAYCYSGMFEDCTALVTAPELHSGVLGVGCYRYMFRGCISLTTAPVLPAHKVINGCYESMFSGCTSLETAPEISAITLESTDGSTYVSCCESMFSGCTSLTKAPKLHATTLVGGCYRYMFRGCTSLTTVPDLSATTLAYACCEEMFKGCTSLRTAPALPATTLAPHCYNSMFYECTSLTTAPELPATNLSYSCYANMFEYCESLVTVPAILPATTLDSSCYYEMFRGCTSLTTAPELPATTLASSCYNSMFRDCSSLTVAPELPATTLADFCYEYMFSQCHSLTTAPALPATSLTRYCYRCMFSTCISLTTTPDLPATTLVERCYASMFSSCYKITYIKMLATNISANECLDEWTWGVASTGTFVKKAGVSIPTGTSGIPHNWTVQEV